MTADRIELPQGTLDLIILKTLALGAQHGWAISERIQQISSDALRSQQGSLYPALHRLERRGWIKAHWGTSENNRQAKYYELTPRGRKQLEAEQRRLAEADGRRRAGVGDYLRRRNHVQRPRIPPSCPLPQPQGTHAVALPCHNTCIAAHM